MERRETATLDLSRQPGLLRILGLAEEPMGVHFTDSAPADIVSPAPQRPISRELEEKGEIDWQAVINNFACAMGIVWRARKKGVAAVFDAERFGCLGAAFYLGFMKPYLNLHPHVISTGIPNVIPGERYADSPETARRFFDAVDPLPARGKLCVIKPLSRFNAAEMPLVVVFFARPEVMSGLVFLTAFVSGDIESVKTPFGPGCSGLVTWPLRYLSDGKECAVLGSFDPSCRKFLKTDEITLAVPTAMYRLMLERWDQSFLMGESWQAVKKKIEKSKKAWGEKSDGA